MKKYEYFSGENGRDEFKRERIAEKIINLLSSDINISPMIINGGWGTGKTEFCHKLINKFKTEKPEFQLLYIDAFQADHADNPLMTILSEVINLQPNEEKKRKLIEKAVPVIRYGIKTIAKAAVGHILKSNAEELNDDLEKTLEEASDKAIDATVKNLLKEHENAKKDLLALQNILNEIAEQSPIVIFIDELDRCRPDFAVQMLETIKHTFDVNGVKFVLITNTQQLIAAIKNRYGEQIDAQKYLDKFIKFNFSLSEYMPPIYSYKNRDLVSVNYFSNLIKNSKVLESSFFYQERNATFDFTLYLIKTNNLSLREVESFVRYLEVFHLLTRNLNEDVVLGYKLLYVLSIFIFSYNSNLANEIIKDKADLEKINSLLGFNEIPDLNDSSYRRNIRDIVAIAFCQSKKIEKGIFKGVSFDPRWLEIWSSYFREGFNGVPDDIFEPMKHVIWCLQFDQN